MNRIRFENFAERDPDSVAIIDSAGHWSRGEIAKAADDLSRLLQTRGVQPGDVAAVVAPNCAEFLIAYLATTQIGLYVVPVNWHLAPREVVHILNDSAASVVLGHHRSRLLLETAIPQLGSRPRHCLSLVGGITGFETLLLKNSAARGLAEIRRVRGRVLSYTSATTGRPKGVLLPLANAEEALGLAIERRMAAGTLPEEHVQLCASMLYHGAPLENAFVGLHMGHVVVLMDPITPEAVLAQIERHSVTLAYIVPSMFSKMLNLDDGTRLRYSTSSLRRVLHAGASCPIEVKKKMIDWWGPIFWEAYGATEGSGTIVNSHDWLRYPGTVGSPMAGTRLQILGEDGAVLPPGSVGNIYMTRYSGERFEYLGDPARTREVYRGDYFTVGDLGYLNEEGFLFLRGRKIDMINLAGLKAYPAEIETVLAGHPQVADCTVFGVPDSITGEAIMAIIQPSPSAGTNLKRDLVRHLRNQLSAQKIPRYWKFVDDIGRDAMGKINKRLLRERHAP